jgi:hypothetical protein
MVLGVLLSLKYNSQRLVGRLAFFFLTASPQVVLALFCRGLIHAVWPLAAV